MGKILKNSKVLVAAGLVFMFGCMMANELATYKKRPAKFSHKVHVVKQSIDCEDCHTQAKDADHAGMPTLGTCSLCHSSDEDAAKYIKPFEIDGKISWTEATKIPDEVKFSHKLHAEKGAACEECHKGIKDSDGISRKVRVDMDGCLKCHNPKKIAADCKTCHKDVDKKWKPASHEHNWKRMHGQVARANVVPPMENRCSLCHTDNTCAACHKDTPPDNHNNFWRLRGHGVQARVDRDSCATCHRTDFCDRCHFETKPISHTGGWGDPLFRHCLTCHVPLRDEGCFTCHKNLDSHLSAPALPSDLTHQSATPNDCRACHAKGKPIPIPHPDNGDSCRNCHH